MTCGGPAMNGVRRKIEPARQPEARTSAAMQGLAAVLLTTAAGAGVAAAHMPEFFSFYGYNASAQE